MQVVTLDVMLSGYVSQKNNVNGKGTVPWQYFTMYIKYNGRKKTGSAHQITDFIIQKSWFLFH